MAAKVRASLSSVTELPLGTVTYLRLKESSALLSFDDGNPESDRDRETTPSRLCSAVTSYTILIPESTYTTKIH